MRLHHLQAGADCLRLSEWLEPLGAELREAKESLCCARSLANVMKVDQSGKIEPVKVNGTEVAQNPQDSDLTCPLSCFAHNSSQAKRTQMPSSATPVSPVVHVSPADTGSARVSVPVVTISPAASGGLN